MYFWGKSWSGGDNEKPVPKIKWHSGRQHEIESWVGNEWAEIKGNGKNASTTWFWYKSCSEWNGAKTSEKRGINSSKEQ